MAAGIIGMRERTLVLKMDLVGGEDLLGRVMGYLAAFAGGAGGLKLLDRWLDNRKKKRDEPIELTAKILDDGDELRRLLLEEVKRIGADRDAAVERAHKAELDAALTKAERDRLALRLERKDEEMKGLRVLLESRRAALIRGGAADIRLTWVLEHMEDGLLAITTARDGGTFKWMNARAWKKLLGLGPELVLGSSWKALIHPEDRLLQVNTEAAAMSGRIDGAEIRWKRGDSDEYVRLQWYAWGYDLEEELGGGPGATLALAVIVHETAPTNGGS